MSHNIDIIVFYLFFIKINNFEGTQTKIYQFFSLIIKFLCCSLNNEK
jgi:hypothetical protein